MKRAHKALLRGLLRGALLVAVIALADPARVLAQLRQAHVGWLLAGLAAAVASNVVSALRWRALARWLGADVSVRDATRWYFQAIGLNALLPGAVLGGDMYRAVVLRRAGQATLTSSWSVVLDRVSGLWMLCAIGGLGAALCADVLAPWLRLPAGAFAALMLAGTALWLATPWTLPALLRRWGVRWLAPLRAAAQRPDFNRQMGWQALASAAVQVLSAAALAAGGLALGVQLPGRRAGRWRPGAGRAAAAGGVGVCHRAGVPDGGAARQRGRLGHARGGGRGFARTLRRGGAGGRGRGRDLRAVPAGAGGDGRAGVWVAGAECAGRRF